MSVWDPLLGGAQERAEHALTLRRTLVAVGWACLVGVVMVLAAILWWNRSLAGAGEALVAWFAALFVGVAVPAIPVAALALWTLRHLPRSRAPRIVVGALTGLAFGLVEQLLFTGVAPWALARAEPDLAASLLLAPLVAGAVAGALVGPRPVARTPAPGRDERAEDALLDTDRPANPHQP